MAITDWPSAERPREKLLQRGPESLSDAELLAIFLRTGVRGKSAVDLARDLLVRCGSLGGLFAVKRAELHGLRAWATPNFPSCRRCWNWPVARSRKRCARATLSARPRRARLSAAHAGESRARGISGGAAGRAEPGARARGIVPRHAYPNQRLSARSGQMRAGAQCRRGDLRAQPSLRRSRAQPRRPRC